MGLLYFEKGDKKDSPKPHERVSGEFKAKPSQRTPTADYPPCHPELEIVGERGLVSKFHEALREKNTITSANNKAPVDSKGGDRETRDTEMDDSKDAVKNDGTRRVATLPTSLTPN